MDLTPDTRTATDRSLDSVFESSSHRFPMIATSLKVEIKRRLKTEFTPGSGQAARTLSLNDFQWYRQEEEGG